MTDIYLWIFKQRTATNVTEKTNENLYLVQQLFTGNFLTEITTVNAERLTGQWFPKWSMFKMSQYISEKNIHFDIIKL